MPSSAKEYGLNFDGITMLLATESREWRVIFHQPLRGVIAQREWDQSPRDDDIDLR